MEFSGSGPGKDDAAVEQMLLDNLLPALLQTCALITVGYYAKKNNLLPAGASTTLGSFAAILALPALCFLSMAQLDLGNANLGVPLGMLVAKVSVAGLVGLLTVTLIRPSKKEERTRSLSALFALLTVSSNDYALGLPIIDALYPASLPPSYERGDAKPWPAGEGGKVMDEFKMSDYIWLMSPITLLIINPVIFAILELDAAVERRRRGSVAMIGGGRIGCCFILKQVLLPTLANPIVFCVALGLGANLSGVELPGFFADSLETLGASFSSISLICLGMSMAPDPLPAATASSQQGMGDTKDRPRLGASDTGMISAEAVERGVRDQQQDDGGRDGGRWVMALLLIAAKSLLLPVVARFVVLQATGDDLLSRFAFIYSTIPPSTQIYIFALKFGLPERHLSRISLATLLGTLLSAPIMFGAAEMTLLDLSADDSGGSGGGGGGKAADVLRMTEQVGWGSMVCCGWVIAVVGSMMLSPGTRGAAWRRSHLVWTVFFLAASQAAYLVLATVCTPSYFRERFGQASARQCTLGIEGMATAARIWGVVLLVSDIHRSRRADSQAGSSRGSGGGCLSSCFWSCIRGFKHFILWAAWLIPSIWTGGLWASGLWGRLDPNCWACLSTRTLSSATRAYFVASSGLALLLATVAISALIWEQRQRSKYADDDIEDDDGGDRFRRSTGPSLRRPSLHREQGELAKPRPAPSPETASSLEAALLASDGLSDGRAAVTEAPLWSSLQLRTVGLSNLVGLLLQVGVGIGAVIPRGGVMLEIIALNDFALFAQGIATGLLLGSLGEAPLVVAVVRLAKFVASRWVAVVLSYTDPAPLELDLPGLVRAEEEREQAEQAERAEH